MYSVMPAAYNALKAKKQQYHSPTLPVPTAFLLSVVMNYWTISQTYPDSPTLRIVPRKRIFSATGLKFQKIQAKASL